MCEKLRIVKKFADEREKLLMLNWHSADCKDGNKYPIDICRYAFSLYAYKIPDKASCSVFWLWVTSVNNFISTIPFTTSSTLPHTWNLFYVLSNHALISKEQLEWNPTWIEKYKMISIIVMEIRVSIGKEIWWFHIFG